MLRLTLFAHGFIGDDNGAALAEYAVLFLVVATGAVAALGLLSTSLVDMFTAMSDFITDNVTDALTPTAAP